MRNVSTLLMRKDSTCDTGSHAEGLDVNAVVMRDVSTYIAVPALDGAAGILQ